MQVPGYYVLYPLMKTKYYIYCHFGGDRREGVEERKESKKYLERRVTCILIFPNLEFSPVEQNDGSMWLK